MTGRGLETGDTIAALSTPPGRGGIGIVRISGPDALSIGESLGLQLAERQMVYGWVWDREAREKVDEVLAVYMASPRTYTREDIVEIHGHGGPACLNRILELCLAQGARLAEPGEFTRRAFLNGRIDLAQAESVADLVRARTEGSRKIALAQLEGTLSREVAGVESLLLEAVAVIEGSLDFPDHDEVEEQALTEAMRSLAAARDMLEDLLSEWGRGRVWREGLTVVIAGRPNVGKSSLMNSLLRHQRALVSPVPGTTRDSIEEALDLGGIMVTLVDTAGLTESQDEVERMGVQLAQRWVSRAEVLMVVLDASEGLVESDLEILHQARDQEGLVVWNKMDAATRETPAVPSRWPVVEVSALEGWGLDQLRKALGDIVGESSDREPPVVSSLRHKEALERALGSVISVLEYGSHTPPELAAVDLRNALGAVGEISGISVQEAILDRVFSTFCVGK